MKLSFRLPSLALGAFAAACSSSNSPSNPGSSSDGGGGTATGYEIVSSSGELTAVAGDALSLSVVQKLSDGTTALLPSSAAVTWTAPATATALDPDSTDDSPLPAAGAQPTGTFVTNPGRSDRAKDLAGVLFVLDPGTSGGSLTVTATIAGSVQATASATVTVSATPAGDATRGSALYGSTGADCAACHGATGHGTDPVAGDGGSPVFIIAGAQYDFPAPGLNAESGNCGSDPAWNAALFAFAARSDIDNGGLTLRSPMPDWLVDPNGKTGKPLTTQDFADIFAFMKTQTQ